MQLSLNQTVADIATQSLAAVRVFEEYGIDYCCGGKKPLEDACRAQGLQPDAVLAYLERATAGNSGAETDWRTAPLSDLIRHIVTKHHEYLRIELPRINQRLAKVMAKYGEQDRDTLGPVPGHFTALWQELDQHMHKEEAILFPVIEQYEAAARSNGATPLPPFGSIAAPIRVMEVEHDGAGDALRAIRESTCGYHVPDHACITYKSLLDGLRELEADLHVHIHLENNILFPRALELEASLR